jgi:D-glucosaminate-6-phosphate ammonia-lyase
VVATAHARDLPVLVDAAGELPPRSNLRRFIDAGADLVAFSGGKAIRGPQATGMLCGRRDLVGAAAAQLLDMDDHWELWEPPAELIDKEKLRGLPRHGIGRALKVSKEQIAAFLTALRLFTKATYDDELPLKRRFLERIRDELTGLPLSCYLQIASDVEIQPILEIALQGPRAGVRALEICRRLRRGRPSVQLGHARLHEGILIVNPLHLTEDRAAVLARRLRETIAE